MKNANLVNDVNRVFREQIVDNNIRYEMEVTSYGDKKYLKSGGERRKLEEELAHMQNEMQFVSDYQAYRLSIDAKNLITRTAKAAK